MDTTAQVEKKARVHVMSQAEGRDLLDRRARYYLNMSGEEFVRAWDAGAFQDQKETPGLVRTAMLLPLGR